MAGVVSVILLAFAGAVVLQVGRWTYNAFLHPLSKYPGPKSWAASRIPWTLSLLGGQLPHRVRELHDEYGPVVRVAPNELSFIEPGAWKDIYTNDQFVRTREWRGKPPGAPGDNLISASEVDHTRFRKLLGPSFSEKAVRQQEPIIDSYVSLLISKLKEKIQQSAQGGAAVVDVVEWLNYATFDIIGDLGWGSSFECLDKQELSGWIQVVLHFKAVVIGTSFKYFPPLDSVIDAITPKAALAPILAVVETAQKKVAERLAKKTDRPDMIGHISAQIDSASSGLSMTRGEIEMNSFAVIVAGSESLTTILTGIINKLILHPAAMQKLTHEVRSAFDSEAAITGVSAAKLPYLNAVLNEGMRITPSIPDGSRRDIPAGSGTLIAGHAVPGGTTVAVPQWSAYMAARNFVNPTTFAPERWLRDESAPSSIYDKDKKDVFHPFGYGAHNCLGQPLAWHEMRVILARLLWNFDVQQPDNTVPLRWESQQIYWTWEKQPMQVKLRLR